jgi:hypothetical protein
VYDTEGEAMSIVPQQQKLENGKLLSTQKKSAHTKLINVSNGRSYGERESNQMAAPHDKSTIATSGWIDCPKL